MKNKIYLLIIFAVSSSCSQYTYILNSPNVSLFEEKGEKQLKCLFNYRSFQPQWSMAVSDKIAYQVNGHIGFLGQSYFEGLGGYYLAKEFFRFES